MIIHLIDYNKQLLVMISQSEMLSAIEDKEVRIYCHELFMLHPFCQISFVVPVR